MQVYLNTASCGLITPETLSAGNTLYAAFEHNSSTRSEDWKNKDEGRIRQLIATFIGAQPENIAMVPNFSWAINGIVQSLKGTERILLYSGDYPSLLEPFRINNFPVTWVHATDGFNIDMEAVKFLIRNNKVDIVALSHVQWSSGYKADIKEIGDLCKQHGVLFIVDATQSMGAFAIDIATLNVDVLAASNYKWMNAGFGTGILYVSDSFLAKYPPVVGGHNSYKMVDDKMMYVPSVQSYEPGSPNMFGLTILAAAINRKNKIGIAKIEQYNSLLTEVFLEGIRNTPVRLLGDHELTNRSSIIYLIDKDGLGDFIKEHNIVVTQRNGYLRVSMHYYNTEEEVVALVDCISAFYQQ